LTMPMTRGRCKSMTKRLVCQIMGRTFNKNGAEAPCV
jgi:hypothetical protein